jgi:EAL domain-containing protein (putative c-di-GMP-specific phosphodiesterase class I)
MLIDNLKTDLIYYKEKMMPLQNLVDHFNNNFAQEHECDFRPFLLNANKVSGTFGLAHIESEFSPVRMLANPHLITGYAAQAIASTHEMGEVKAAKMKRLLTKTLNKPAHVRSIVSFDRLCRIVNLLNYLSLAHDDNFLITKVDPHHILGIPYNHGAYFEQAVGYSGLKTQNIVISMMITGVHQIHFPQLLKGLNNYRDHGYQIALNIGNLVSADKTINLIKQLCPDYIIVTAPNESYASLGLNASLTKAFRHLKELTAVLHGKMILQEVKQPEQELCATQIGFDLVQGVYYEKLPDVFEKPESHVKNYHYID